MEKPTNHMPNEMRAPNAENVVAVVGTLRAQATSREREHRFNDLLDLFRDLARKVSQVVSDVYQVGDGSVADYLRLKPPEK